MLLLVYNMRVACVQISSVEQARMITLSMDSGSNCSITRHGLLSVSLDSGARISFC